MSLIIILPLYPGPISRLIFACQIHFMSWVNLLAIYICKRISYFSYERKKTNQEF